jgi:proline iminopeptidase
MQAQQQPTEGTVPAAGTELFYVTIGSGPPLLVLGGTSLGHSYLRAPMDRLADSHQVIYFDQRGSGRTPLGDVPGLSLEQSFADVVSLLDGLGLARTSVLGHSMGGNIAMLFAAGHRDRVGSLVLAMPGPPFAEAGMAWEELESAMGTRRTAADDQEMAALQRSDAFRQREPEAVETFIRNMYAPFFVDHDAGMTFPYGIGANGAATAVEQEGMLFGELDTAAALAGLRNVTSPTLVLSAELDPIPESFAVRLAAAIPGAVHHRLSGAGHFAFIEAPDTFFPPVTEFLAANP